MIEVNINFAIDLFLAAEKEARETERFILVAIGAIYAYLTTPRDISAFSRVAWFAPPAIAFFAAVRAMGLLFRQRQILKYLESVEPNGQAGSQSLALWLSKQPSVLALPMAIFYLLLIGSTLAVAIWMIR